MNEIGHCEELFIGDHLDSDPTAEFKYLVVDVLERGIRGPSSDEHDGVDGYSSGPCCGWSVEVCANI